ncbi:MAG: VOC family protein [Rhodospirillales bacterium]|nr:VOC family protein [Rhodospirillales bacterium]
MAVVGPIEQILLPVRDIGAARRFYGGVLKLAAIADGEDLAIYDTGQAKLILFRSDAPATGIELAFTVASLEAALAELVAADVRIVSPPRTEPWGGRTAKIADPDGHVHSLVQYP